MKPIEWKPAITAHARPACPNLAFKSRRLPSRRVRIGTDWARVEEVVREVGLGVLIALVPVAFLVLSAMWWMCLI